MAVSSKAWAGRNQIGAYRHIISLAAAWVLLSGGLTATSIAHAQGATPHRDASAAARRTVTWRGGSGDGRWSNPTNWQGRVVPGHSNVVRFDRQSGDAVIDPSFAGVVAGLVLESNYQGTVRLDRDLAVHGTIIIAGGKLEQANSQLTTRTWRQSGGAFVGGKAPLMIEGNARITGGILTTSKALMRVESMEIRAPGVVRMGANAKLNITGDGEPLLGDGLLDTMTNRPNSVEYTGHGASDITTSGPARAFRDIGLAGRKQNAELRRRIRQSDGPTFTGGPKRAFTMAGAGLTLKRGDDSLNCAVIDEAGGFAYFGTVTSPGYVVKIDLATFTRVGALTLNSGEDSLSSAVIDPVQHFVYFGTDTAPGNVVKIDLETFTLAGELALNHGENSLLSAVIDTTNGFAYFGTDTNPGIVVKVNLTTFERARALSLNPGENFLSSAVIDPTNGYAYFGTWTSPGIVVKIKLSDFTRDGALTLEPGENGLTCAVIDPSNDLAFFGTDTNPGIVVKINLSSMTRVQSLTLNAGESFLYSAVIDVANGYAYFGADSTPGKIIKIGLSSLTREGALTLETGEDSLYSAVVDLTHGLAYFGTYTSPGIVVKINLVSFSRLDAITLRPGESYLSSTVIDRAHGFAYFGTDTDPGVVVKVNLATMTRSGAITLNQGESFLYSAVIDSDQGFAYFGTYTDPGIVVKLDLGSFSRVGGLTLGTGEGYLSCAVIDPGAQLAYFGTDTDPGIVVKVNLTSFSKIAALPFEIGENGLTSAVIDPNNNLAYFGTHTDPGKVVKVNLQSFSRVGVLPFATGESFLYSAVIDSDKGFALFGTWTSPGKIVRVNLGSFTRTGAITLDTGENYITSATLDPENGFAYFGTDTTPGLVVKIDSTTSTRVGAITLGGGQNYLYTALIDPLGGYAYFGTYMSPGVINRIDLGNTKTTVISSSNPSQIGTFVTFTATVNPIAASSEIPTGTVTFKDYEATITGCENVVLDASAQALCTTSTLDLGGHVITASYSGSGTVAFNPSMGTLTGGQVIASTVYALTLSKAGSGDGTVISNPSPINCGTTCTANYLPDTVVTLTASAASDANFVGWSGDGCSGIGLCQVTMDKARTIAATFDKLTPLGYFPITSCRVFDTRNSSGAPRLEPDSLRFFTITGTCTIPAEAKAISINLTTVEATAAGDLRVIGGHLTTTQVSTISVPVGRARANNAIVQLSTNGDGSIAVINSTLGTVHLILDVNGYFQ